MLGAAAKDVYLRWNFTGSQCSIINAQTSVCPYVRPTKRSWKARRHSQSSNPRRDAASLNPNPSLDLWPFKPKTISLVGVENTELISYTKFEHFGNIRFWVMMQKILWKMHLLTQSRNNCPFSHKMYSRRHNALLCLQPCSSLNIRPDSEKILSWR